MWYLVAVSKHKEHFIKGDPNWDIFEAAKVFTSNKMLQKSLVSQILVLEEIQSPAAKV